MANGQDDARTPLDDRSLEVAEALEALLVDVESAVVSYLVRCSDAARGELGTALQALDADTTESDAFRARRGSLAVATGLAGLGTTPLDVVGQTTAFPIVHQLPLRLFQAQVALVRAAKDEVRDPSPATLDALEAANERLAEVRRRYAGA